MRRSFLSVLAVLLLAPSGPAPGSLSWGYAFAQTIKSGHVLGNGTSSERTPTDTSLINVMGQSGSGLGAGVATALGNQTNVASGVDTVNGAVGTGNCLKWGPGVTDSGFACGGGGMTYQTLTVNSTNTLSALGTTYNTGATGGATLYVNGLAYTDHDSNSAFSVSGTTVTWNATNAGFPLLVGYTVSIAYSSSNGSTVSGSLTGVINSGSAGQIAYFPGLGTTLSGTVTGAGVLSAFANATNASGGVATINGAITTGNCLKWGPGVTDSGSACGSGGGNLNILGTGQFYQNLGANIQRLNDRIFLGGATVSDGSYPSFTYDWLSTLQNSIGEALYDTVSQVNVLSDPTNGSVQTALLGASQTKNATSGAGFGLGGVFFAYNNNTTYDTFAWGVYAEAQRNNSTAGQTNGFESEVRNAGGNVPVGPYDSTTYASTAQEAGCGAGMSATGQYNCSSAFMVFANPMPFDTGILIRSGSLASSIGGQYNALMMPPGYSISWVNSSDVITTLLQGDASGNLIIDTNIGGNININGHAAASCSAGTVNLTTLVVTNGIITHC